MQVALMIPCYIDLFYPEVGIATLERTKRNGAARRVPEWEELRALASQINAAAFFAWSTTVLIA